MTKGMEFLPCAIPNDFCVCNHDGREEGSCETQNKIQCLGSLSKKTTFMKSNDCFRKRAFGAKRAKTMHNARHSNCAMASFD